MPIKISNIIGAILLIGAVVTGWTVDNIADANETKTFTMQFSRGTTPDLNFPSMIESIALEAGQNQNYQILLIGYTGTRGTEAGNEQLGMNRAKAAAKALERAGIDDDRIVTISRGEAPEHLLPRGKHETDTVWQQRLSRVEAIVTTEVGAYQ